MEYQRRGLPHVHCIQVDDVGIDTNVEMLTVDVDSSIHLDVAVDSQKSDVTADKEVWIVMWLFDSYVRFCLLFSQMLGYVIVVKVIWCM